MTELERIKAALADAERDRDLWRDAALRQHAALVEIAQFRAANRPDVDLRLVKAHALEAVEGGTPSGNIPTRG